MIGIVRFDREALIRLVVRGPAGQAQEVEAAIDTGFTGYLTLPPGTIALLGLPPGDTVPVLLGDGRPAKFASYYAVVDWDGQPREVAVLESDGGPLVGMKMLAGNRLIMDVRDGGPVIIEPLP